MAVKKQQKTDISPPDQEMEQTLTITVRRLLKANFSESEVRRLVEHAINEERGNE
jgi:hypothetical protein